MKFNIYLLPQALLIIALSACSANKSVDPEFKYDRILTAQKTDTGIVKEISSINFPATNSNLNIQQSVNPVIPDKINPPHGQPGHICGNDAAPNAAIKAPVTNQNSPAILPKAASNAGEVTINPAHGQPGHRCGIAVGAPLNNIPATTANQQQNTKSSTPEPAKSTTADKNINPAHGQPGHRCDIAAGSPLNSKPVTPVTQNKPEVVNTTSSNAASPWGALLNNNSPAVLQQNQPADASIKTTVAPGMNPPHGQPGHRCDIAAGTPLNQPIIKKDSSKN
jgi:hypothetical protein